MSFAHLLIDGHLYCLFHLLAVMNIDAVSFQFFSLYNWEGNCWVIYIQCLTVSGTVRQSVKWLQNFTCA